MRKVDLAFIFPVKIYIAMAKLVPPEDDDFPFSRDIIQNSYGLERRMTLLVIDMAQTLESI